MRLFIVAEDAVLDIVYEEIRSATGGSFISGRLKNGRVERLSPFALHRGEDQSQMSIEPVGPGDVILVFGDAVVPDLDAASRIWVVDGLKFLRACSRIGDGAPNYLDHLCQSGPAEETYQSYARPIMKPADLAPGVRLVVNSFPKSGSIWMMAMIGNVLGLSTDKHVQLVHGAEMELASCGVGLWGSVALVRDLRDVVISWFHEAERSDRLHGFSEPRYRSISEFYHGYFLGRIFGNPQYYYGDLERWLDYLSARAIPILKYEDLLRNPEGGLKRLMNFWKFDVDETDIAATVSRMSFATMKDHLDDGSTYIAERLGTGHAREGRSGGWQTSLPQEIASDIEMRFSGFMRRFGYLSDIHRMLIPKMVKGK